MPQSVFCYLHSTMYLLNLNGYGVICTILKKFTFHYVSIKSIKRKLRPLHQRDLHSTMYLLNRLYITDCPIPAEFTFHYVSIKSITDYSNCKKFLEFTFHYVSIKSDGADHYRHYRPQFTFHYVSIKSLEQQKL